MRQVALGCNLTMRAGQRARRLGHGQVAPTDVPGARRTSSAGRRIVPDGDGLGETQPIEISDVIWEPLNSASNPPPSAIA